MKRYISYIYVILLFALVSCGREATRKVYNEGLHIVPEPASLEQKDGTFVLDGETCLTVNDERLAPVSEYFKSKIERSTGFQLGDQSKSRKISLQLDESLSFDEEEYELTVTPEGVTVAGKTPQAVFYGMQTVMQLLPAEIESEKQVDAVVWEMPCVVVKDKPAYGYRGMMLDVCRHFHDVEFVKKQLDIMAMFKMNRFHWHLTDDHLWTIEIKKYPRLTEVGSVRHNADGTVHKGFYTQEQIKEVVAYAKERFIEVIPELELPGHALAALTAYPNFSCTGGPFSVRNKWGVEKDVYCPGNEDTFRFLEDVIEEIIPLFPGKYFHIGGDECPKDRWEKCPKCQKRIREEGLKDEHELQSYFVHRIESILLRHGKRLIGWDEILEGGLAPSAVVMSWRGEEGGIKAASMGHDVIMTPHKWLYVDYGQGAVEVEPVLIHFSTLLSTTYNYNPTPDAIPEEFRKHILGAQCNMWTEYADNPELTEYLLYPRMLATAELTWTPFEKKNFDSFVKRMFNQLVRLDEHHINYHIPIPEGPKADYLVILQEDTLSFTNSLNLPMVFTRDGSVPTAESTSYESPLFVKDNETIRIASVLPSGKMSKVRTIEVVKGNLASAENIEAKPGVVVQRAEGTFYYIKDLGNAKWGEKQIVADFVNKGKVDLEDKGAYCYTGYFSVPEDGVYYLSTEMDELQVDGKVVLSNDGKLVRHTHNRTSLALQKGYHSFRLLFINNNIGGYPRIWNNPGFVISQKSEDFHQPDNLSH